MKFTSKTMKNDSTVTYDIPNFGEYEFNSRIIL